MLGEVITNQLTRLTLHLTRLGRLRFGDDPVNFLETYHRPDAVDMSANDLRRLVRQQTVVSAVAELSPRIIVDVGCGVGELLGHLSVGKTALGVDYAATPLRYAAQRWPDATWVRASAVSLPLRADVADAVICLGVLDYLEDDVSALAEISRILKRKGRLIISVSSDPYFAEYFHLLGHHRHYTRVTMERLIERAGFRRVKYLDDCPTFYRFHLLVYGVLTLAHRSLAARRQNRYRSMYAHPILGRVYRACAPLLRRLARQRPQTVLAACDRTTFLIAEKI